MGVGVKTIRLILGCLFVVGLSVSTALANSDWEDVHAAGDDLDSSLVSLQQGVVTLREANVQLQQHIAELPDKIKELHQQLNVMRAKEKEILDRSLMIEKSVLSHRDKSSKMKEKVGSLTKQLNEIREANEELKKKVEEKQKEEAAALAELDKLRDSLAAVRKEMDVKSDYESQKIRLKKDKLKQRKLLIQKKKQLHDVVQRLDRTKNDQEGPVRMKLILEEEKAKLDARMKELKDQELNMVAEREAMIIEESEGKSYPVFFSWNDRKMSKLERQIQALKMLEETLQQTYREVESKQALAEVPQVDGNVEARKLQINIDDLSRKNKILRSKRKALQMEMIELDKEKANIKRLQSR